MNLPYFLHSTASSALCEQLADHMSSNMDILSQDDITRDVLEFERRHALRFTPEEIRRAVWDAEDSFVDSYQANEHDTEEEGRADLEPLTDRLARWEALRPGVRREAEILAALTSGDLSGFQTPLPPHDPARWQTTDGFDDGSESRTNRIRAEEAEGMLPPSLHLTDPENLADVITNLLHLAHSLKHDPLELLDSARRNFLAEAGPLPF